MMSISVSHPTHKYDGGWEGKAAGRVGDTKHTQRSNVRIQAGGLIGRSIRTSPPPWEENKLREDGESDRNCSSARCKSVWKKVRRIK